jgi:hypothetical protein
VAATEAVFCRVLISGLPTGSAGSSNDLVTSPVRFESGITTSGYVVMPEELHFLIFI